MKSSATMSGHGLRSGVAEIQGLYGPFSFPEKLLQKIWLRSEFNRGCAQLSDGRDVRILYPGKWNLLGGPDFKGARLQFADRTFSGDVELHLHAVDWAAHRHADDPAYANVILHVVLFVPPSDFVTRGSDGREIPLLTLLPLLLHDLEEYAAAEAVETLANRPGLRAIEELGAKSAAELSSLINDHAQRRWRQKVHFARLRLRRVGWDEACHHAALEILGYRFNRVPMLRTAAKFPLAAWVQGEINVEEILKAEEGSWSLQGVRPANHPRRRLHQYEAWVRARPDWSALLEKLFAARAEAGTPWTGTTAGYRRERGLSAFRADLCREIGASQVSGTRFDNLVCDGFLPLLAARARDNFETIWFHWFAGDQPPSIRVSLRALGLIDGRNAPASHGAAQGFLGWLIEREARMATHAPATVSAGREA